MIVTCVTLFTNCSLLAKMHNLNVNRSKQSKQFTFGLGQTSRPKDFPGVNTLLEKQSNT